ncbi:MAG: nucleoside 2-deoxyribosyltransferase [Deltaproteobacteria bacterium]|nr:nucleoside 2-deoxyribosyltransferase [Deltaproteobacteria bacterium]
MPSVYLAGPDLFYPGYPALIKKTVFTGAELGFNVLFPGDGDSAHPTEIFQRNLKCINDCDGIIANLNPFRGHEPDSGTVFEIGYGYALGKWIVGYMKDQRDVLSRLKDIPGCLKPDSLTCADGSLVEDFGLPVNLMPSLALWSLTETLEQALIMANRKLILDDAL